MTSISERALVARVNRKLAKDGERLHLCSENSKWFNELGRYFVTNSGHYVSAKHVFIGQWAQELGAI